ncbi:MAG: bifunctional aldolase/short-chain dehydrogenase [Acidimicrobiales bacterium]|nr:bifunctional aldolase/short-chain dehydrogenase [Acidimicrobiales bacterium]MCB1014203.1 bifunctional aldolase/short-chain dehydrogenase [Acidimicrobiales bacterium]MCB9372751.1 bifunctional aldolase/short-chain dehydrogenase [Microthrixaceae bacterium]
MRSRWSDDDAAAAVARWGAEHGEDLALRTYTSRLLGGEPALVLHGGGNTSVKRTVTDRYGDDLEVIAVKASGHDLATVPPEGHVPVRLDPVRRLRSIERLDDAEIVNELRLALLDHTAPTPSIETPVHALVPHRFVDHTHADAVLALSNQVGGEDLVRAAMGDDVIVLPYVFPGFELAHAVADALDAQPTAVGMVWGKHGVMTWGATARESYERMVDLVSRAEAFAAARGANPPRSGYSPGALTTPASTQNEGSARVAPVVRGALARRTGDADRPYRRVVLEAVTDPDVVAALSEPGARERLVTPPLTTDHLIRTRPLPAWLELDEAAVADDEALAAAVGSAVDAWAADYDAYLDRHRSRLPAGVRPFDPSPRIVAVPGVGLLCAGEDAADARIVADIARQTVRAKAVVAAMGGTYESVPEDHLFDMEHRPLQHAKLRAAVDPPLAGRVVLVTGAAGAIGSGICEGLLADGAHVVATDLPGDGLDSLTVALDGLAAGRALGVPLDVTDPESVTGAFAAASERWGGVDGVVVNAGLAHVSALAEMDLDAFRRLERVNVDGTLLLLREAANHFARQGTGGDIVLVSTKNVFAPGAGFGAYSATKAAAHQLARIATLELAPADVRVNMVAPDAVFSHESRPSGLWAEVGPDRMKARDLDAEGLEAYYRDRNLLKARITATHVARAVSWFLQRPTPTTGATLPIDGGLPDATPR